MRPIDADALIEKCGGWYVDECTESGFIGTLENLLATEPTIQPQSTTGQLNDGAQSTARSTDLIDRQAAIDAVDAIGHIATMSDGDKCIRRSAVKYTLSMLPTSQPVATDTNVGNNSEITNSSDAVSRQAAIDAAKDWYEGLICGSINGLIKRLNALSTIQPEPQEGHWINGKCDLCGEHAPFWCMASTYHESNYCPNCGAKMKGERQK